MTPWWFSFDRIVTNGRHRWEHRSHISFMRQDRVHRFLNEQPFTVFVLGASQVSVPIGTLWTLFSKTLISSRNEVVTTSSTIDDLMDTLVQCRVIPADYHGIYGLGYGRSGQLWGSSTIESLGAGLLSHFYLRVRVCGGTGKLFPIFWINLLTPLGQHTHQHREDPPYHQGILLCQYP